VAHILKSKSCKIEYLTLYNNNIGNKGAKYICKALKRNESMKVLNLQMNFIKDEGASYFIDSMVERKF
jgi:Ran GTPase-activating protein (RanGAP) involved in mRNA processing and transport